MAQERSMMEIISFSVTTFVLGVVCSIPGLALGYALAKQGIARKRYLGVIVTVVGAMALYRLWFPQVPMECFIIIDGLLVSSGLYSPDIWTTYRKGRWWWVQGHPTESDNSGR